MATERRVPSRVGVVTLMLRVLRHLRDLLTPSQRRTAGWLLVGMVFVALLEATAVASVYPFIQIATSENSTTSLGPLAARVGLDPSDLDLKGVGLAILALFVFKNSLSAALSFAQFRFIFSSQASLTRRLLAKYLRQPYELHLSRNSSEVLRNLNSDCLWIFTQVMTPLMSMATEAMVAVTVLTVITFVDPVTTIFAAVILGGAGGLFLRGMRRASRRQGKRRQEEQEAMYRWAAQSLASTTEIKLYGSGPYFEERFGSAASSFGEAQTFIKTVQAMPRLLIETLAISAVLLSAIFLLSSSQDSLLPRLGVFAVAAVRLMPSVNRIVAGLAGMRYYVSSVDVVHDELFRPGEEESAEAGSTSPTMAKSIEMKGVSFRYPTSDEPTLEGVDITLAKGSSTGIAGPSGSGKSTLASVLLGLLSPSSGDLLCDGAPMRGSSPRWRGLFGYIPQKVVLLDDSVRRNVAFGLPDDQIDDGRVWAALRAARLDDVVGGLPEGLDTFLGEDGLRLSGGQRQRIGIARALHGDPEVIVLDEATSALDEDTERAVSDAIDALAGNKTLVIIAHRLSTLRRCDRVILMEKGRLVDEGTLESLARRNGSFGAAPPDGSDESSPS